MITSYFFKIKAQNILLRFLVILLIVNIFIFFVGFIHNYVSAKLLLLNLYFFLPAILITAYSPVYYLEINKEKHEILINYMFLYVFKKHRKLTFAEFSYRFGYGHPFISLGGYEVNIYFNRYSIATLNTKFGWKKKQLKEIISVLEEIKPPKPRLLDKKEKV